MKKDKTSEKGLNEIKIGIISDSEFKEMIINMLSGLKNGRT